MSRLDGAIAIVSARLMANASTGPAAPGSDLGDAIGDAMFDLFAEGASAGVFALADVVIAALEAAASPIGLSADEMWPAVVRTLRQRAGDG